MISPNAILIAATLVILGLFGVAAVGIYFGFRFLTTVAIVKMAPDAQTARTLLRAAGEKQKEQEPEKVAMEMPSAFAIRRRNGK